MLDGRAIVHLFIVINRLSAKGTNGVMKRCGANTSKNAILDHGRVQQTTEPVEVSGGAE